MSAPATDKAVILAAGLGTRMRKADGDVALDAGQAAVADTGVKALIPIGRPFLDYVLHVLADAGYRRVCLVVGPDHHQIRRYYGEQLKPKRLQISFATQAKPLGTADAVAAAEAFVGDDLFLAINSDNYYPFAAARALRTLGGSGLAAFDRDALLTGSNIAAERISKFAVVDLDPDGLLRRVIEKPDETTLQAMGRQVLVSMNCWMFSPAIFRACRAVRPSPRGELEITDAVQHAIDSLGERFRAVPVREPVLDLSSRNDIQPVAQRLAGMTVEL